jgi:mTERF domain-containing protein
LQFSFYIIWFLLNQTLNLVMSLPSVLLSKPHKTPLPMLEFFQSKGFSSPDHVKIISSYPWILKRSLEDQIVPAFDFLENLLQSLLLVMNDVFTP